MSPLLVAHLSSSTWHDIYGCHSVCTRQHNESQQNMVAKAQTNTKHGPPDTWSPRHHLWHTPATPESLNLKLRLQQWCGGHSPSIWNEPKNGVTKTGFKNTYRHRTGTPRCQDVQLHRDHRLERSPTLLLQLYIFCCPVVVVRFHVLSIFIPRLRVPLTFAVGTTSEIFLDQSNHPTLLFLTVPLLTHVFFQKLEL